MLISTNELPLRTLWPCSLRAEQLLTSYPWYICSDRKKHQWSVCYSHDVGMLCIDRLQVQSEGQLKVKVISVLPSSPQGQESSRPYRSRHPTPIYAS